MLFVNSFSLNMLQEVPAELYIEQISLEEAREIIAEELEALPLSGFKSAIGHADTAVILSDMLGIHIPFNRESVTIHPGGEILVAQYSGPRLNEGTTVLPEGASIKWMLISVS
jgi:hypothetical protein